MSTNDLKRQMSTSAAMEAELNKEKAAGLGRTARKLEALLDRCSSLKALLGSATGHQRELLVTEYQDCRKESETQRWYLYVQREALGLRRHDDVDAIYPRPPVIS